MVIPISRREVLNNLIRFKENLLDKQRGAPFPKERIYTSLINRHTGDIRFTQKIEILSREFPKQKNENIADWQEIYFEAEGDGKSVQFHLTDEQRKPLNAKDFDPLAVRILFETLDVLNKLASLYHAISGILPEKEALQHLSDLHIAPIRESIEHVAGWSGYLSRVDAETKLRGHPVGTYLIRKGESFEENLAIRIGKANHMTIHVCNVTFVEGTKKISDYLLIQTDMGWAVCRDEMDLSLYQYHPTLQALLDTLKSKIKTPL